MTISPEKPSMYTPFTYRIHYNCNVYVLIWYGFNNSLSSLLQDGDTALLAASQNGHTSTVDVLLRNGADHSIARTVSTVCFN